MFKGIDGLYEIIPLDIFRKTEGVNFDLIPASLLPKISSMDRVIHKKGAISPGSVAGVKRPWYMHPGQDDNLIVLFGTRYVDLYTKKHGKVEFFKVKSDKIEHDGEIIFDGPAMLVWPRGVFHRVESGSEGSASLNFAVHYNNFDINTNFSIYKLDTDNGKYEVIRNGTLDQKA